MVTSAKFLSPDLPARLRVETRAKTFPQCPNSTKQKDSSDSAPFRLVETANSAHLFRDLIDATAVIDIGDQLISVHFQKRAHNPLLLAAGFAEKPIRVPWLGKQLQSVFG